MTMTFESVILRVRTRKLSSQIIWEGEWHAAKFRRTW